jgi:hypothetical protein
MGTISKNYTFTSGEEIKATDHNANFDTFYNAFNGGIENVNIGTTAGILDSQLAQIVSAGKVNFTAISTIGAVAGDIIWATSETSLGRLAIGTTGQKLKIGYTETADQSQTTSSGYISQIGDIGGQEYQCGQSFKLSADKIITAVEVFNLLKVGTPSGNWTIRIETDSSGLPSGTLADANASVVLVPPADNTLIKGIFTTPFSLSASTLYWIVISCGAQSNDDYWKIGGSTTDVYTDGNSAYYTSSWFNSPTTDLYFKIYTAATTFINWAT